MEQNRPQEERSKKPVAFWIFIGLLITTNAITLWLYLQEKNKAAEQVIVREQIIVERENVKDELLQLQKDFELLETDNKGVKAEIEAKKAEIVKLLEEAEKHKGDAYFIAKLKKESETLRSIMRGYVRTIDSLGTLNVDCRER